VQPRKLIDSLQKVFFEQGFAQATQQARSVECAHSNRVHLIIAQVLTSAYVVRFVQIACVWLLQPSPFCAFCCWQAPGLPLWGTGMEIICNWSVIFAS
jgi:hypothetical protein